MKNGKPAQKSIDLHRRRSTVNLVIVLSAFGIALASVYYTRILVNELQDREERLIKLYVKHFNSQSTENNTDGPCLYGQGNTASQQFYTGHYNGPKQQSNQFTQCDL